MKINWLVRVKNKMFWMAFIPALALLVKEVLAVFGVQVEFNELTEKLLNVVTALFSLLALIGVVVDPTTEGAGDSNRALGYDSPWVDAE